MRIDDALRRATSQPETIEPNAYAEFRVRLLKHIGLEENVTISSCEFVVRFHARVLILSDKVYFARTRCEDH